MSPVDAQTALSQKSDAREVLKQLHALGAVLSNQDWDTPLDGEDLQYLGFLIKDLTFKASKKLFPGGEHEAPQGATPGGE